MKTIPEIEGLRAIAVMAVVLFHAQFGSFSGGYVGVDVFFVVSGYLITRLLWNELQAQGTLSLQRFFARRILRLAPALALASLGVASVFALLLPPAVSKNLGTGLMAAQLSLSNFWFYASTDYFANNLTNPSLHTWSLAVEEQFYLMLPLLLLLSARLSPKKVLPLLLLLVATSLVAATLTLPYSASQAFYFPWLRAWELLTGSVLAVSGYRLEHRVGSHVMLVLGLLAILLACVFYTDRTSFPGVSALLPVLGTSAVIVSTGHRHWANQLLGLAPMRWLGKISYSVYLVHWPIVCIVANTVSLYPFAARVGVVLISLLCGWLSWKWVETPWRSRADHWSARRVLLGFVVCNLLVCLGIFGLIELGRSFWLRYPVALSLASHVEAPVDLFRTGTCFMEGPSDARRQFDRNNCLGLKAGQEHVLIMGDSHAANLWRALQDLHPQTHFLQATAVGCRPLNEIGKGAPWCLALNREIFDTWLPLTGQEVGQVILAGRWEADELPALQQTVSYLRGLGKQVLVIGPTPEYFMAVPLMLAYEQISGLKLQARMLKLDRLALDARMAAVLTDSGAGYFSMVQRLCDTIREQSRCETQDAGIPLWSDRDHFTAHGARFVLANMPLSN